MKVLTLKGAKMSNPSILAKQIASHIRKIEDHNSIIKTTSRLLAHETACLHECLTAAATMAGVSLDDSAISSVTLYGGGQPKDKN